MTLRLPDELADELRALADTVHVSINSVIVDAISEYLRARHHETVMAIAHRVITRDAEILDRLAKA